MLLVGGAASAAERSSPPIIQAVKAPSPPVIDGHLDDAVWAQACRCTGFWNMEIAGQRASEETNVYLLYDERNLYFGCDCLDSKPAEIVAEQRKRGGSLESDDHVAVDVDVLNRHNEAYDFQVSPIGTQNESIPGGAASQIGWRGDWQAAATINSRGWQAEMAIPLRNLRYLPGAATFGITVTRFLARKHETSIWPNLLNPGYDVELAADWVGLDLPVPRRPVVAMPYLLTDARAGEANVATLGLDLKHDFAKGLTALGTLNPDFRTIEDEVQSVDFTYTERALTERRPFFSEGNDAFFPPLLLFYSRRIGAIDAGAKAFGHTDGHTLGLLATTQLGGARDLVFHTAWKPKARREFWGGLTHHTGGDAPTNTALGAGFSSSEPVGAGSRSFDARIFKSQTAGVGGDGLAFSLDAGRSWGPVERGVSFSLENVGSGYDSVLGYVPERGVYQARLDAEVHTGRHDDENPPPSIGLSIAEGRSLVGRRSEVALSGVYHVRRKLRIGSELNAGERDGATNQTANLEVEWDRDDPLRAAGFAIRVGKRRGANYSYAGVQKAFKPRGNLSLQITAEHIRLADPEAPERQTQVVATAAYDLTAERTISSRLVFRDGRSNIYFAYRQALRAGPDLFILLGDPNADRTTPRLATKVVWPFLY